MAICDGVGVRLSIDDVVSSIAVVSGPPTTPATRPSDCASRRFCSVLSRFLAARSTGKKGSLWRIRDAASIDDDWTLWLLAEVVEGGTLSRRLLLLRDDDAMDSCKWMRGGDRAGDGCDRASSYSYCEAGLPGECGKIRSINDFLILLVLELLESHLSWSSSGRNAKSRERQHDNEKFGHFLDFKHR
jgi:hypothetical protein